MSDKIVPKALNEFIKISQYAGMREDLVQAGGGNSSVKISDTQMLIKASGYQLADISLDKAYALVDYQILVDYFLSPDNEYGNDQELEKKLLSASLLEGGKPSIETFLHAITNKFTLHTHPIVVNVLLARKNAKQIISELFGQALFVDYATPGINLAELFFKTLKGECPKIIFLKNHGFIVSAENAQEVIEETEKVLKLIENYLSLDFNKYHIASELWQILLNMGISDIVWTVNDFNVINSYKLHGTSLEHCFCPDCIVFLGKKILSIKIDPFCEVDHFIKQYGKVVLVEYKNNLYICASSVKKALEIQSVLSFAYQVASLNKNEDIDILAQSEQRFLLNWESEKYRQNLKN